MSQYFLNHLGLACALGCEPAQIADGLFAGDRSRMRVGAPWLEGHEGRFGAIEETLPELPQALREYDCRNNRLALLVIKQIEAAVAELRDNLGARRIGVVMGTSTSGIASGETRLGSADEGGYSYRYQQQMGGLAEFVARYLQLDGPRITVSTACSSSANAFASARRLLAGNVCDAVVVGGVDTLCGMTVKGFHSLSALSAGQTQPFSAARDGINLGEAGAVFVMSREPARIRLCGVAASSDAHHMSAPHPQGRGAEASMRAALADARLEAADIGYLNLHGTGTTQNDVMEAEAAANVLGGTVPCSSTKPLTGHTLGAAGALEAAFCWLALDRGQLPPHAFDGEYDPALRPLNLYTGAQRLRTCLRSPEKPASVPEQGGVPLSGTRRESIPGGLSARSLSPTVPESGPPPSSDSVLRDSKQLPGAPADVSPPRAPRYAMSNSFAFGGSNCSLILGLQEEF